MSRLRNLTVAATIVALSGAVAAGATILPADTPTLTGVQTMVYGWSTIRHGYLPDGSTLTAVQSPRGSWELTHRGLVVTPMVDGTFLLEWPCNTAEAVRAARTPDGRLTVEQGGASWSFVFVSAAGQHTVVPEGFCGARVVGV